MELCYSKSRKVNSAGGSFKNCMANRVQICKLKNGWNLVKCANVRSVSPSYETLGRGWVPTRSVVLQDLSCSWVVQASAQLLSSPPDNAGEKSKGRKNNKTEQSKEDTEIRLRRYQVNSQVCCCLSTWVMDTHSSFLRFSCQLQQWL